MHRARGSDVVAQSIKPTARIVRSVAGLLFIAVWLATILAVLRSEHGIKGEQQVPRSTREVSSPKVTSGAEGVSDGPMPPPNLREEREELKKLYCFGRNRGGTITHGIVISERERKLRQQHKIRDLNEDRNAQSNRDSAESIIEMWEEKKAALIRLREKSSKEPTTPRGVILYFERDMREAIKCHEVLDEDVFDRIMALPPEHRKVAAVAPEILPLIESALKEERLDALVLRSSKKR